MGALFIFKMENKTSKNILTYIIIIVPIVIYISLIVISFNTTPNKFETKIPIQNQISDVPNKTEYQNNLNNRHTPKKMSIFKMIIFISFISTISLMILFLILIGINYLIDGIYMRMLLFKKFGIIRFDSVNKITL